MNKKILFFSILLLSMAASGIKASGFKVTNNTEDAVYVSADKMVDKDPVKIEPGDYYYFETTARGERGIYYTGDKKTYYATPKYSSPDSFEIEDERDFQVQETFKSKVRAKATIIKKDEVQKSKTEAESKKTTSQKQKIEEKTKDVLNKAQDIAKIPDSVIKTTKEVIKIIDSLEPLSQALLSETEKIKEKAKEISNKKLISEKINLLRDIIEKNIATFISAGLYPFLVPVYTIISLVGKDIVGPFDKKTGKSITDIADTIQKLRERSGQTFTSKSGTVISKSKNEKSIGEYVDIVRAAVKQAGETFSKTNWIRN